MTRRRGETRIDPFVALSLIHAAKPKPPHEDFTSADPSGARYQDFTIQHVSKLDPDVTVKAVCFELRGEFFIFLDRHRNVISTARAYGVRRIVPGGGW